MRQGTNLETTDRAVQKIETFLKKDKRITTTEEVLPKGNAQTVRTHTDIFVPAIRGLDMTPGSETLGEVFTIK